LKNRYKFEHLLKTPHKPSGSSFWLHFGANLGNFGANLGQLGANMAHLGPNLAELAPNLAQLGTNLAPKFAPRCRPEGGKREEKREQKTACNMIPPRPPQETNSGPILVDFGSLFGRVLDQIWQFFVDVLHM